MTITTPSAAQARAARLVGAMYLVTMATAVFAFAVRSSLMVSGDAAQTARNIAASARLFRVSIVADLFTYAGVILLLWALYVVLEPIHRGLALLAAFFRLAENAILAVITLNLVTALRLASGQDPLTAFPPEQLQALARLSIGAFGAGHQFGMVFLGLGSSVFSYLWFKSRYVPRAIAAWGILASSLLTLATAAVIVFPELGAAVGLAYMAPMGVYEVGLGLWLVIRGIRAPRGAGAKAGG